MAKANPQKNLEKYIRRIEAAEKNRDNNYKELWARCYKRWRNYVDPLIDEKTKKVLKDRSNISIPYTFTQVETILPRLVETLFAARPYVTVKGREESDDVNAKNMETMLDWQMNERMDMMNLFKSGLKELCIYGTSVAYTGWRLDERKVTKKRLQPVMMEDGSPLTEIDPAGNETPVMDWQPTEINEIEYDDPEVQFIDLGNFYVDQNAVDLDDARFAGHRCYHPKEYLQKMKDQGVWNIDWKKIPKDSKKNEAKEYRMGVVGLNTIDDNPEHDDEGMYEVHYYCEDNKKVVIINRAYIALESANPYWHQKKPYCKDTYTDVPHEFYGMGIVEIIGDLHDELNTERNQRIDFRNFLLRRMWKVRKGADIDKKQLTWRQNGFVEVNEMDDLQEISIKEAPNSTFTQEGIIKRDMQDASGAQDVVMGTTSGGTATEAMRNDNNSAMRFKLVISSAEKRLLVPIARFMMQNNQQFVDKNRMMRVAGQSGDQWVTLTPEQIQGEFDLMAAGSSVEPMANKEAFKQRMVELYGIVAKDPFMQQFPEKRRNLLKKVFEAFEIKNTDDLLPTDEELSGVIQQQWLTEFISSLPPELQALLTQVMGQQPAMPGAVPGGEVPSIGDGSNTAPMEEPALQAIGGGGAL